MKREDVYSVLDSERDYQDTIRRKNEGETRDDDEKTIAEFILYMENKLNEAKENIYYLNNDAAMSSIRKVTALGVAAMEAFGVKSR
jgi:hypothetical protein